MSSSDPFDGDEDAALRYAIELSLQESEHNDAPPTKNNTATEAVTIISDDDDEDDEDDDDDLDKGPKYPSLKDRKLETKVQPSSVQALPTRTVANGLAGLNRKQMEAERLARLGKRKEPASAQSPPHAPSQKIKINPPPASDPATSGVVPYSASSSSAFVKGRVKFPKGTLKRTWALGYPRDGDDIKIEEVLQRDELELAVMSSFQWDDDWLLSKVDIRKTKLLLIAYAGSDSQRREMQENVPNKNVRFCFPPMMPYGTMHSKLQILRHTSSLRIVVPSGNLVSYDWGETGVMENMVFIIDLPYIKDAVARDSNHLTAFGEELACFLQAQGLDASLVASLKNYNFSETEKYGFVHSIGQPVIDHRWKLTGYCGLGSTAKRLGLATEGDIEIDYVTSSLGAIKPGFVRALYYAAQGDIGLREHNERSRGSANKRSPQIEAKFRVYFPSHDTITKSRGGEQSAGTICTQSKWWDEPTFPKEMIRDCISARSGLLMHNKLMLVRHLDRQRAWAYAGSANFSESAWGRLNVDKKTGETKMTCRNWECGVLVPVHMIAASTLATERAQLDLISAFKSDIPIPMVESNDNYGATGEKKPWFYSTS